MKRCFQAGLVLLVLAGTLNAAETDPFAGLANLPVLEEAELTAISGEAILFRVIRNTQKMVVTTFSRSQVLSSTTPKFDSYAVPVTTAVVRNQDVTNNLAKTAITNTARNAPAQDGTGQGNTYHHTQFPAGSAGVTGTKDLGTDFGTAIKTNATQTLPYTNKSGTFVDGGYYIHYTPYANTYGCVGVTSKTDMSQVLNTFNTVGGDRNVQVTNTPTGKR